MKQCLFSIVDFAQQRNLCYSTFPALLVIPPAFEELGGTYILNTEVIHHQSGKRKKSETFLWGWFEAMTEK